MNKLLFVAICVAFCSVTLAVGNCITQGASDRICTQCAADYGIADYDATTAPNGCEACTSNAAAADANCNCNTASSTCDACPNAGTGLSSSSPIKCVACTDKNCATCSAAAATCTVCSEGYGLNKGACTACKDTNCASCASDYTVCDGECKDGFAYDTTAKACTACANGCKTCEEVDSSCDACPTGITLNKNDTTAQFCCPANCSACSSTTKCTACNTGYTFNADKGTCFGFKTGASLTLGAIVSVALFSLLF